MFNDLISVSFVLVVGLIGGLVLLVAVSLAFRFLGIKRIKRNKYEEASLRRCIKCGYVVEKLDIPRCPECGSVIGFTKTFTELGVSDKELKSVMDKKARSYKSTTEGAETRRHGEEWSTD